MHIPENIRDFAESESPRASLTGNGAPVSVFSGGESPSVEACLHEAIDSLSLRRGARDANGRFAPGNTDAVTTGARSEAFWEAVAPAKASIVERVLADLALGPADVTETLLSQIDAFAEVTLLRRSQFVQVARDGGPITSKRRTSAVYAAFLAALDREMKLAAAIGLERRARPVQTAQDILS